MADIFISYTSSDRGWAFWIARACEALGHVPHVHEWEIGAGDDIYAWMERRHDAADHVLCVVSDAYLKAPYSTLERNAALWQAAEKRPGFVLMVAVAPCRLPTLSDHILRCELHGVPEEAARQRFRDFLSARSRPDAAAFPGRAVAVSNIPIRVPTHFMGRDDAMAAIAAALGRYEGRAAVTALHGLRGVGKTTLAAAYAEAHRAAYRATWWIRAQTGSTMRADLVALGVRLGWAAADDKEEPALAAVMERLRHEGEGVLLVYDNAVDARSLKDLLPRGGAARVLITSNDHAWRRVAEPVEIRLWPREVGADYLLARTGRAGERADAEALSDALGGLPLAHEQAAAYCEQLGVSLAEYGRRFAAAPVGLLDDDETAPGEYHDGLTVAKTFALAIAEAATLHPAAEPLLLHAALLAPEPIPLFLFAEGRAALGEPLASLLGGDGLDRAVAKLRTFALVDRETIPDERDPTIETDCIRLHRLVREVAVGRWAGEARLAARGRLRAALAEVYPGDVFRNSATWPRARRLEAVTMASLNDAVPPGDADAPMASLLNRVASYRQATSTDVLEARLMFERALDVSETVSGKNHPGTLPYLNNLALLLWNIGDLGAARPLCERVVALCEKTFGSEHVNTACSLDNFAGLLRSQGDFATARALLERTLAINEKVLGPEHPDTALSLNNLGVILQNLGDPAGARPLHERALTIRQKTLGPRHHDTASSLDNLAGSLLALGDLAAAWPLCERALAVRETSLGPEHPDTALSLNNLAVLAKARGDPAAARSLYERALAIWSGTLGPEHPDTVVGLNNLANLLQAQGDPAGARPLYGRALAAREKTLGPAHPSTRDSARSLADTLTALGEAAETAALRARYGLPDPSPTPA